MMSTGASMFALASFFNIVFAVVHLVAKYVKLCVDFAIARVVMLSACRPYSDGNQNTMESISLVLLALITSLLAAFEHPASTWQSAVVACFVYLPIACFVAFLASDAWREYKAKKRPASGISTPVDVQMTELQKV
jgi:hypothetical protein